MGLKPPFKGSDKTAVTFTGAGIDLIKSILDNTSVGGNVIDVGAALDAHFAEPQPGPAHELSHDELALMLEMIRANKFDKRVRADAAVLAKTINTAVESFYKEG